MRKSTCVLCFWGAVCASLVYAQDLGEIAFRQALLDLGNDFRLMCVAAHPDDEDGATLALHRYKFGVETFAIVATRGEGGQNEIGPELYEDLAVIRTREMQAAAAITGAELHFLDLPDFGYSKSIEETQAIWGEKEALRRLVSKIREIRPQVIITHHGRDKDHGHHQAIGRAVLDAFDLAANPAAFPEQIAQGLAPWQPLRLYIRAWTPGSDSVTLDIAELEPLRGMTYAEIAAAALKAHASQGMTFFIEQYLTGRPKVHYDLVKTVPDTQEGDSQPAGPLFAGLPASANALTAQLPPAPCNLHDFLEPLLRLLDTQSDGSDGRSEELARAAACAAELRLEAHADDPVVVPGQTVQLTAMLTDFGRQDASAVEFSCSWGDLDRTITSGMVPLHDGQALWQHTLTVPADATPTLPARDHAFDAHAFDPQIQITARAVCGDAAAPVRTAARVEVARATEAAFLDAPYLVRRNGERAMRLDVLCTNHAPGARTDKLRIETPEGWSADTLVFPLQFQRENEQQCIPVILDLPEIPAEGKYSIRARLHSDEGVSADVSVVNVKLPQVQRIGLVESYDDTLRTTLDKLGLPCVSLTNRDFHPAALDACNVILIDVRAYQYRQDLIANNNALLDYVHRGGTLIVMYQKTLDWKPEYAPYPIHLSRNRVTQEDVPITLLAPDHPLFHTPNAIQPEDWDGWVQERGLYFPERWDPAYTPLIACHDPGEDIPPGACLVARHGEGVYCYTALVWYRQLRRLHPGALRLFANLLALE